LDGLFDQTKFGVHDSKLAPSDLSGLFEPETKFSAHDNRLDQSEVLGRATVAARKKKEERARIKNLLDGQTENQKTPNQE
jgi:hypothetical protein